MRDDIGASIFVYYSDKSHVDRFQFAASATAHCLQSAENSAIQTILKCIHMFFVIFHFIFLFTFIFLSFFFFHFIRSSLLFSPNLSAQKGERRNNEKRREEKYTHRRHKFPKKQQHLNALAGSFLVGWLEERKEQKKQVVPYVCAQYRCVMVSFVLML